MRHPSRIFFLSSCVAALTNGAVFAQNANTPPGYFVIPTGFDFPAQKATLEQYISSGNVSAGRLRTWNVFAGMTQSVKGAQIAQDIHRWLAGAPNN